MYKLNTLRWRLAQFLEIRWWRYYLRRQPPDEYLARKRKYWREVLHKTAAGPALGQNVLDAGCGPAGIYMILETLQVDAVDPLLDKYAMTLDHFHPKDYPWVRFFSVPFESWIPRRVYDWVFCMNAVNHFFDLEAGLKNLYAAAAPGGHLLLSVDVHKSGILKHIFQWIPGDALHPHQYALSDYQKMLERQGFQILQVQTLKTGRIFDYVAIKAKKI